MGARGMWGVPPRVGPALQSQTKQPEQPRNSMLSGADQMEFEMFWLPDARQAGVSEGQALNEFVQELAKRRTPLSDEPYSH